MKNIKKQNITFFDHWANLYDYSIPIKPWLVYIQKKAVDNIKLDNNIKILDIGCGTGDSLFYVSKLSNSKLFGVDISRNMLKIAKKKLWNKAILKLGDVENLPYINNTFDYVLNTEAFHHFPNPNLALKEIHRVLRKGGKLILTDINFNCSIPHKLFKILEPGHVKIYNRKEFYNLFVRAGFKVLKQERVGLFAILTIGRK